MLKRRLNSSNNDIYVVADKVILATWRGDLYGKSTLFLFMLIVMVHKLQHHIRLMPNWDPQKWEGSSLDAFMGLHHKESVSSAAKASEHSVDCEKKP